MAKPRVDCAVFRVRPGLLRSESREQLADLDAEQRVDPFRGDFSEGLEDEQAFGQGGMGQGEVRGLEDLAAKEEEVEIDDAWTLGGDAFAPPAHCLFDGEERVQEGEGLNAGFEQEGCVEEARLAGVADGLCIQKGTDSRHLTQIGNLPDGFVQIVGTGAEGRG